MTGHISVITIIYSSRGKPDARVSLADLERHVRYERLAELLDDLAYACRDVLAAREASRPHLSLVRTQQE